MLSVTKVSFSYKKKLVLNSISFFVKKGNCLSVVGGSGSGKSTLLKLIFGEMDVSSGSILWPCRPGRKEGLAGQAAAWARPNTVRTVCGG